MLTSQERKPDQVASSLAKKYAGVTNCGPFRKHEPTHSWITVDLSIAAGTKSVHSDPPAVRRPCAIEAGSQGCEANCASQSEYAAAQKDGGPACRPLPDYWVSRSFSLVILILT